MRVCWIGCVLPLLFVLFGGSPAFPATAGEKPLERNDTSAWYPFPFGLDDTNLDSLDLTGLLDAPAGKHGFLTVRDDGHFYFQDGTRARFFGTNVAGATAIPTKEQAPILAARLAKYGVNMLRIHALDGRWAGNFLDYKRGDTRRLSEDMLDRLGFFVAALKQRGIYVYLDLLDYRLFQPADGVRDAAQLQSGWQNSVKGASTFNERMIELQMEYAEQFLTYHNPHTGLRFVDDPAVAVVEITNENSLFYTHNTSLMLPSYTDELRQRWNRWLVERFGTRDALAQAWTNAQGQCALLAEEDPAQASVVLPMKHLYQDPAKAPFVGEQSPVRVNAMVRFFFELQRSYYGRMREHLKALGVKVPITGTNQTFCPASNYADAVNDFMSRNNYWLHPNVQAKPMFTFRNLPLVGSDLAATSNPIVEVASSAVAGKPMISPEFNFPWPNEHRAECLPLMAAYACLQDWDGLLFYNYRPDRKQLEMFGSQSDPVRWGQFPAAALLFHRQDVAVAKNTVSIGYSEEEIFTARPSHGRARTSPYRHLAYLSKVRNVYEHNTSDGVAPPPSGVTDHSQPGAAVLHVRNPGVQAPPMPEGGYTSDTEELNLNTARGLFTIRTARTKAAVGFLGQAGPIDLDGVVVRCRTPFAAIMVTSLDDRPIVQSQRLLVTAVARAENTGQAFDSNKSRVPQVGQLPVIAEPVDAEVEIKLSTAAMFYPLDETGRRRQGIRAELEQGVCRLRLADLRSPWCEVEINPALEAKPRPMNELSEQERSEGFVSLFDGRSLDGWQGLPEHWIPHAGVLTYRPPPAGQKKSRLDLELLSERQYADFTLRFEFKLDPGSNNGVAIRTPLEGDPAFVGMEIQVIDTDGWTRGKLKPFQVHGSIYGVVPAKTGHLKPAGEWNAQEILCDGRHVKVTLNGAVIVDANLDDVRPIDGQEHPGLQRETGHLGFLGHTGSVAFRHIRLKDLAAARREP